MTERAANTEKCWPIETREEVLARIRSEHGDEAAAIVERDWANEVKGEHRVPRSPPVDEGWREGVKSKRPGGVGVRGRYR